MKLYTTPSSPFGRIARIVILEKNLSARVEIIAPQTRTKGSDYYEICPSGRVPYLICEDGRGLEDSVLIASYLDNRDGTPTLHPNDFDHDRLAATARSFADNLAVWGRELYRPTNERSPGVIDHERTRSARLAAQWNSLVVDPIMNGPFNMAQITLICALDQDRRNPAVDWRTGNDALTAWYAKMTTRPSILETQPPMQQLQ